MESLDASCAAQIAGWLLDERDLAALRCANRFWSGVLTDNPGLWSGLITRRFGAAAHAGQTGAAGAAPAGAAAAGGAAAAADPERRFRQLAAAALQRPVAALERLIWLDGQHLQRIDDPSSTYGTAVRIANVWWLELGGRFCGVLPGTYRLSWRLRFEAHGHLHGADLIARQEEHAAPLAGGSGSPAASGGEAREAAQDGAARQVMQEWAWTMDERSVMSLQLLDAQVSGNWLEIMSPPFEVPQLCDIWAELRETRAWKGGIVFDRVRLVRQRAQQVPAPAAAAAAAPDPAAGSGAGSSAGLGGLVCGVARALGLGSLFG